MGIQSNAAGFRIARNRRDTLSGAITSLILGMNHG